MLNWKVLALCAVPVCLAASGLESVKTRSGIVSGVAGANPDVTVFKGMPYAAPPTGDFRWREPQPAQSWTGTRAADSFSPNCMQGQGGWFPPNNGERPPRQISEDCLYLNIYTGAKSSSASLPVIVFVHGGGLTSGAGTYYDGEDLARKGAVIVTINYRLGVFGFLAHPDLTSESSHHASGNYGLLDQIAALRWVHDNIAAFGGDPNRVTLMGQSAGSWSVNLLMASPLAHGMFQRAIGESGGQFGQIRSLADAEKAGAGFMKAAGADSLAALRHMPADVLQKAGRISGATVDGWFLPADVYTIFSSATQNDVPLLVGSNAGEAVSTRLPNITADALREEVHKNYGDQADAFFKLYPFSSDQEARLAQLDSHRDELFGWPVRAWAQTQARTGQAKVFYYHFEKKAPGPFTDGGFAAPHGGELPYVFDWVNGKARTSSAWTDADRKLAATMSSYWLHFAATGDPNGKDVPAWPPYKTGTKSVLIVGDAIGPGDLPLNENLDLMELHFSRLRATK
jgi:para-nitrobenzyl esterase